MLLQRRYSSNPYRPTVDKGHPLSQGLVGCWSGAYAEVKDTVQISLIPELSRGVGTDMLRGISSGQAVGGGHTAAGLGMISQLASDAKWESQGPSPSSTPGPTSPELRIANNVSMFWYGTIRGTGSQNPSICAYFHNRANNNPFYSYGLTHVGTDLRIDWNNSGTYSSLTISNVMPSFDIPVSFSATLGTGLVSGFKNGLLVGSGSSANNILYDMGSTPYFSIGENPFWHTSNDAATILCLVWARELTPTEHLALSINPFQIFVGPRPYTITIIAPPGGAGNQSVTGGTISSTATLFAPSVGQIISNGTIASTLILYAPSIQGLSGFNVLSIWP